MDIMDMLPEKNFGESTKAAKITIIGVGGGGGNAANRMYTEGIQDVDFIICNSDQQDLEKSPIPTKVQLGEGHGCGSNAEKGQDYAKEATEQISTLLEGTEMVFITAGMGGGTGTGAAPVIAEIAKNKGILTVAIVTMPYKWEGSARYKNAMNGIEQLSEHVDSILIINNDALRQQFGKLTLSQGWKAADGILSVAARSIAEIMQKTGFVNVDFEDVRAVMANSGVAIMASGSGSGENRAFDVVENTLESPLLNKADIRGAKRILLNLSSSKNEEFELTIDEQGIIMDTIREKAGTDVNITWGYLAADDLNDSDEVRMTLIATGFEVNDIPDLREEEPVKKVRLGENRVVEQVEPQTSGTQTTLKFDNPPQTTNFDYGKVRSMEDISEFEQPAFMRKHTGEQTSPQATVTATIQGTAPTQFTINKNDNGIVLGENKFLNNNVD